MMIPIKAGISLESNRVSTYLMLTNIWIQLFAFLIDQWQPFMVTHRIIWNR